MSYLKYSKVRNVQNPLRANVNDAIDIFIPMKFKQTTIKPGQNLVIPSGLKFEVSNHTALIAVNKSGIASKKELIVGACLIDHGYAGEVHIDIHNIGNNDIVITSNMKIVQLIHVPVICNTLIEVPETELYKNTLLLSGRGSGALGSTGV